MNAPLLWHIPLSHYSEKVRWALDYKGIAHRRRVLGPDYLIRVWRATGQGKLPVLWLDGRAIADSTRIIAALEEHYSEPSLYPRDAAMRQRALTLEDDLDETLGPALRAAIVTPLFRHDPDIALRVLTTGMGGKAYPTLRPLLGIFPAFYRFRHKISESNLERDRAIVAAALDRLEHQRQGRAYLVGGAFTVADLTAASLLGALLQPPKIQYPLEVELPLYLTDYRAKLLRHPATACIEDTPRKLPSGQPRRRIIRKNDRGAEPRDVRFGHKVDIKWTSIGHGPMSANDPNPTCKCTMIDLAGTRVAIP